MSFSNSATAPRDREHEFAGAAGGIDAALLQTAEPRTRSADLLDHRVKISHRTSQAIEPRHNELVVRP